MESNGRSTEAADKESRLRALLEERGLDAIVLRRASSFSWATAGASSVVNGGGLRGGCAGVHCGSRCVIANNIETPRLACKMRRARRPGVGVRLTEWHSRPTLLATP
ncbi:MAG: hypothetical protein WKH64_13475 [Chloroflexia bacterium]